MRIGKDTHKRELINFTDYYIKEGDPIPKQTQKVLDINPNVLIWVHEKIYNMCFNIRNSEFTIEQLMSCLNTSGDNISGYNKRTCYELLDLLSYTGDINFRHYKNGDIKYISTLASTILCFEDEDFKKVNGIDD